MTNVELYILSFQYESYQAMSIDLGIRYKELRDKIRRGKVEYSLQGKVEPIKLWDHVGAEPIEDLDPSWCINKG